MCVCRLLPHGPAVQNRTTIFILQHPRERFHAKGTAVLALRGLARVHLQVAHFDSQGEPAREMDLPPRCGLLYPHPRSIPLETLPTSERPEHLLLLDGTWGNARRLYRCNPWLHGLPHYHLEPATPERYRIRGEPDERGRSTIEAIVAGLRVLEPDIPGLDLLLDAFDQMIDQQIAVIQREAAGSRRRLRLPPRRPLHAPLLERPEKVLALYTEPVACGGDRPLPLHWVALRPASGDTFERLLRPEGGQPSPRHLAHMELTPGDLAAGTGAQELRRDWDAFLGEGAVVVAWSQSALDLAAAWTSTPYHPLLLKAAYCNLRRSGCGSLAQVLKAEGLRPLALPFRGRSGRRLAQTLAVMRLLSTAQPLDPPRPAL